ncbi:uncharacterized protein TEOVI_000232700 [Trypanosoma equiperdum]|uniref:Uncharacterized protein n=2 Tax=Trypanozoon TaxID=39700 RepID=Q385B7_TRYB2|nr:hypothetical protein, conserved [Trypanosoma brucei brucei TREU927]EAN79614.1 hypothetical protein, conserved [Trypanosoma brucei brucei TREU927]SCU70753.1 hypothetical protein, conserved [Trypanosoma equiperdum]
MTTLEKRIEEASGLIYRARAEETPDGNPLVAARNYIAAMEIITNICKDVSPESDNDKDRFFLFQVRQRMEVYQKRVQLLLSVAAEMGLDDIPEHVGNTVLDSPPHAGDRTGAADFENPAVPSTAPTSVPPPACADGFGENVPPLEYFFSQQPQAPTRPHPEETESVEALLGQFSFDEVKKE